MVGCLIITLLQVHYWVCQWKTFKTWLRFDKSYYREFSVFHFWDTVLLSLSPNAGSHFTVPQRVEGWIDLGTHCSKGVQPKDRYCCGCHSICAEKGRYMPTNQQKCKQNISKIKRASSVSATSHHCQLATCMPHRIIHLPCLPALS